MFLSFVSAALVLESGGQKMRALLRELSVIIKHTDRTLFFTKGTRRRVGIETNLEKTRRGKATHLSQMFAFVVVTSGAGVGL